MTIDPTRVGVVLGEETVSWTARDVMLYALGVGAGVDDLAFTTDNSHDTPLRVLPTFAAVIGTVRGIDVREAVGDFDASKGVLGGQTVRLNRRIPSAGEGIITARIRGISDKGLNRSAIIEVESSLVDATSGDPIATALAVVVVRGGGGFGGDPGPSTKPADRPGRPPDHEITYPTREDQALIYRLSGDYNPVHSDPWFAKEQAGFDRPILHGLCSYGFAGRALLQTVCGNDDGAFGALQARFAAPVFPGEALTTRIWETVEGAVFETVSGTDGRVVIDGGRLERSEHA
jgi:acyl dehydratase